ncbi:MAG: phage terminase large subunit, partial [Candidatus Paceibacterota bacterium]
MVQLSSNPQEKERQLQALNSYFATAIAAGCPRPQMELFVKAEYIAYPWQLLFHAKARAADLPGGPTKIGLGGSRGPGKSHAIFVQTTVDDCQRVAGLKGLFLRQTGKAAKESLEDLVVKALAKRVPHEYAASTIKFPNGSRILMGGFKDEKDIDKYIGIEYDFIAVEEINQLSEKKIQMLLGSMRTTKEGWRPRLYASFNPGGKGHAYVVKTFVMPHKLGRESDTAFIPATYRDNPGLNQEYIDYLLSLKGQLGEAWREGNFDILAGAFFPEWREEVHTCDAFPLPKDWRRICFMDYGHSAQTALYWAAIAPDGKMYVYRELYRPGLNFSALADEFVAMTPPGEVIDYLVADPAIWAVKGESAHGLSGAKIFADRYRELTKREIQMVRANNDRINGWAAVREYLAPFMENGKTKAKLQVFKTC